MIILTALFVAAWVAIVVLRNQGYSLDNLESHQSQDWNSHELQPIAIPVRDNTRFPRN